MSFGARLFSDRVHRGLCAVVAAGFLSAAPSQAAVVFQDDFDRVGALSGSTPSLTLGGAWSAGSGFQTDGTKVNAGPAFLQSAFVPLPVPITSGNVYTLSATMFRGLSSDDTAIMIFGFFDTSPTWNGSVSVDEGHAIAIAPRNNRPSVQPILGGSVGGFDLPVATTQGSTFGVRLYEESPNVWFAVAVEVAPTSQVISLAPTPISLASIANIASIGMISGSTLPPYIDNLTLDVTPVPEPSSFALLASGLVGIGVASARRRGRPARRGLAD